MIMTIALDEQTMASMDDEELRGYIWGVIESILIVLTTRFGEVPPYVKYTLMICRDLTKLDELLNLAVTCKTIDAFSHILLRSTPRRNRK
jgi:hypothetical protein